jgi:hypothetical protein
MPLSSGDKVGPRRNLLASGSPAAWATFYSAAKTRLGRQVVIKLEAGSAKVAAAAASTTFKETHA